MVLSVSDSQRLYVILDRYTIFRKPGTKIGSYIQSIRVRDVLFLSNGQSYFTEAF